MRGSRKCQERVERELREGLERVRRASKTELVEGPQRIRRASRKIREKFQRESN